MKKLILLGGVLAGGKSTFSTILRERFGITVVNKDRLKEILGDNIITSNREENKKLSVISFEIMSYLLECGGDALVLESNFKDYELRELRARCELRGFDVLSVIFDADDEVLHKRFLKRLGENRHPVHKSQDFTDIRDFKPVLDELRSAEYFGRIIRVDCTDFSYQTDEALYSLIEDFLNN